jgi:hypothetical protein
MSAQADNELDGLHWSTDGYAAISGALLAKAQELDRVFRAWAAELGGTEHRFPSMIAAKSLAPIAYLKSFPHLATFATSGNRDEKSLKQLAEQCGSENRIPVSDELLEPIEQLLTPAACYHFYHRLAGSHLDAPLYLTTNCQCHRREEHYLPLQRQWCFQMRELVCIGDAATIDQFIDQCRKKIDDLIPGLGIEGDWQSATDPFFDPSADPKALAQILEPVKQELCTRDGLAIASLNKHRSFFGECYDIRFGEDAAHSACVAFGIERWLHALFQAHGSDPSSWPAMSVS